MRLLVQFGARCESLMDRSFHGLSLKHLEIDETWTFCGKKQSRLTVDQKVECHDQGDQYLWLALDQETKLVVSHVVGKRSGDNARKLIRDVANRLVMPSAHASDAHGYQPICQISTDMYVVYPEAIDQFFGPYVKYGQIRKEYRSDTMAYTPSEMVGADRKRISNIREDETNTICTSHVERWNLTNRVLMKRFTRLGLGFSKKLDNLKAACSFFMCFYNFVWRTRKPGKSGRYRVPAAMAAGVTNRLWDFEDLYEAAVSQG
jgi:IS1 family transposase